MVYCNTTTDEDGNGCRSCCIDQIDDKQLYLPNLLRRYERYLQQNRGWLLQDASRRSTDHHIFEAVFHFNLYYFLLRFLESYRGQVTPEFPTGTASLIF